MVGTSPIYEYGECADVGGGVPDAPHQRIETPYRAVEDAGPYGECADPTGNAPT